MQEPLLPRRLSKRINRAHQKQQRKEWEKSAASFVTERTKQIRKEILDAFKWAGLVEAKDIFDLHIKALQDLQESEKGIGGFGLEQTEAMIKNLKSFYSALEQKARQKH